MTTKNIDNQYKSIVESQSDLICRFLTDGTLTFVNNAFCQHYHSARQELLGVNFYNIVQDERLSSLRENISILNAETPQITTEISNHIPGGKTKWLRWTDYGIFNDQNELIEIQSVGHDITDSRLAEIAAKQYAREMDALNTATTALLQTLDLESLLGYILDAAIGALPHTEQGRLHLIAKDTGKLELRAVLGFTEKDPRIQKMAKPDEMGIATRVVRERAPMLINDTSDTSATESSQSSLGGSAIIAPLILDNHVLGAISLQTSNPMAFTESDLQLLTSFAATATAAIHNAQLHSNIRREAITDELTGLYNRRGFREFGNREVQRKLRYDRELAAILIDLDDLKAINDKFGHNAGDEALCFVANQCVSNTRKIDLICRYGGDEFVILLPETDLFSAANVADRLRDRIAKKPLHFEQHSIQITVSIGVTKMIADTNSLSALISRADDALYLAKQAGKNRVEVQ